MKIKVTNEKLLILIIYILFLFGYPFRVTFFNGVFKYFDVPFVLVLCLLLYVNRKKLNYSKVFLLIVFVFTSLLSDLIFGASLMRFLIYFFMMALPLLMLCIDWDKIEVNIKSIKKILATYNVFIFLITLMYIVDLLTKASIMKFISNTFVPYVSTWLPSNGQSLIGMRYATFLGQYLETNYIYIVFYIINTYFNFSTQKKDAVCKQWIINIVAIIGVLSSGSKTGFLLLAFSLIIFNAKKISSMIGLGFITIISYFIGAFNLLLNRIQNESLSTGRFEYWDTFLSSGRFKVHFPYGLGDNFNAIVSSSLGRWVTEIVQELPLIALFYKNGVIGTIAFTFVLFISPFFNKKNNFFTRYSMLVIFIIINSFNGLLVTPDTLITYMFSIVTLILITNLNINKYNIEDGQITKMVLRGEKSENSNNDMV